jgi:hypothetical protein
MMCKTLLVLTQAVALEKAGPLMAALTAFRRVFGQFPEQKRKKMSAKTQAPYLLRNQSVLSPQLPRLFPGRPLAWKKYLFPGCFPDFGLMLVASRKERCFERTETE